MEAEPDTDKMDELATKYTREELKVTLEGVTASHDPRFPLAQVFDLQSESFACNVPDYRGMARVCSVMF